MVGRERQEEKDPNRDRCKSRAAALEHGKPNINSKETIDSWSSLFKKVNKEMIDLQRRRKLPGKRKRNDIKWRNRKYDRER